MSGGEECLDHDMPELPVEAQGFGLAQAFDRFVYLCGGYDKSTIGNQIAFLKHFETNSKKFYVTIKIKPFLIPMTFLNRLIYNIFHEKNQSQFLLTN